MYCKNCGKVLNQGEMFCGNCGSKVENENVQNQTISNINNLNNINQSQQMFNQPIVDNQSPMNNIYQSTQPQQEVKKQKNKILKILAIIGGVGVIILIVIIVFKINASSEKLVCESNEGNITIMYNEKEIIGYISNGLSYDLEGQKEYAKVVGIDAYIIEFDNWFKNNTSGYCTIDGEKVSENDIIDKENSNNDIVQDGKRVGNDEYGYITIPENWTNFIDMDGNTSLQYSYANVYIVSLNYYESSQYTAKDYASNYMYNKQNSSDVTGVTGATVQIGKNKEYTAYQVYMYYPSDGTYLVTYWFEAGDNKVHYIALEGPEELNGVSITDYLDIPESFSLSK